MGALPWSLHEAKAPEVVFKDAVESRPTGNALIRAARRVYIKAKDIERWGYTSGCPKCEHEMRYGAGRTTVPHSDIHNNLVCIWISSENLIREGVIYYH